MKQSLNAQWLNVKSKYDEYMHNPTIVTSMRCRFAYNVYKNNGGKRKLELLERK